MERAVAFVHKQRADPKGTLQHPYKSSSHFGPVVPTTTAASNKRAILQRIDKSDWAVTESRWGCAKLDGSNPL